MAASLAARLAAYKVLKRNELQAEARNRYADNPDLWIEQKAKGFLYDKTREVAQSIALHRRTAVQSCHDAGKSWLFGRIVGWWLDSHLPGEAAVVTTATTNKQVRAVLWKEIRRVHAQCKLAGRTNQTEWWLNGEMVAVGIKPSDDDPTAFQGIHAKFMLVLIDEGGGVPKDIFMSANSLIANEYSRLAVIGNPDDPDSYFRQVCSPDSSYNVVKISAYDTPNFTGIEAPQFVRDVLISKVYVEELIRDVGIDSGVFIAKVLGEFPENKVNSVVPYGWAMKCKDEDAIPTYTEDDLLPVELGVDVGAGGDETSIRVRYGRLVGPYLEASTPEPKQAYDLVVQAIMESRATRAKIDMIGIGWGLIGMLRMAQARGEHHDDILGRTIDITYCEIVGVNVGQSSTDPTRFSRLRDQLWWEVGRGLTESQAWNFANVDDVTISQLCRTIWRTDLANRHRIETKLELMKRTGQPSPNRADALLLAYCEPPELEQEYVVVHHEPVAIGPAYE